MSRASGKAKADGSQSSRHLHYYLLLLRRRLSTSYSVSLSRTTFAIYCHSLAARLLLRLLSSGSGSLESTAAFVVVDAAIPSLPRQLLHRIAFLLSCHRRCRRRLLLLYVVT